MPKVNSRRDSRGVIPAVEGLESRRLMDGAPRSSAVAINGVAVDVAPQFAESGIGQADSSFGQGGVATATLPATALESLDVTSQADGTELLAGVDRTSGGLILTRVLADGEVDATFGNGGALAAAAAPNFTPRRVEFDAAASRIFVIGAATDSGQPSVASYDLGGNLVTDFGSGGVMSIAVFGPSDRVETFVPVGGKLAGFLVGGALSTGSAYAATIVALNPDGSPDMKFGSDGAYSRQTGGPLDAINAITVGPKGEIYAVGTVSSGVVEDGTATSKVLAVALASNGKLSKSFNKSGEAEVAAPGFALASGQRLLVQPDGKLLMSAALATDAASGATGVAGAGLIRLTPKGALDTGLAGSGLTVVRAPVALTADDITVTEPDLAARLLEPAEGIALVDGGRVREVGALPAGADTTLVEMQTIVDGLDLVASAASVSTRKPYKFGARVAITLTVTNAGTVASPATVPVQVFESADSTLAADALPTGAVTVKAGLKPGMTKKIKVVVTAPAMEGTYYLFASVNSGDNAASEITTGNNAVGAPDPIVVTASGKAVAAARPAAAHSFATSELFSDREIAL